MKYAAIVKDDDEIQSPFFKTTIACWEWIRNNDPEGYEDDA